MLEKIQQDPSKSNSKENSPKQIFQETIGEFVKTRNRSRHPTATSNAKSCIKSAKRKTPEKHKSQKQKSPPKKKKYEDSDIELLPLIDPASPINPYEEEKNDEHVSKKHVFCILIKNKLGN